MRKFKPKPVSEKTTVVTARIPESLMNNLTNIAKTEEVSRTDVVTAFLSSGVEEYVEKDGEEDKSASVFE